MKKSPVKGIVYDVEDRTFKICRFDKQRSYAPRYMGSSFMRMRQIIARDFEKTGFGLWAWGYTPKEAKTE